MEASAQLAHRWQMGLEARALLILTAILLAFGLATVYSASAIVEMQAGYGHAHLLVRQLIGMAVGVVLFAIAAVIRRAPVVHPPFTFGPEPGYQRCLP